MNGINLTLFGALDDPFDIKELRNHIIIVLREIDDLICLFKVPGIRFFGCFYHIRPDTHFSGGLNDPDGDLATVGYE